MRLADRLRQLRKERGLSQKELARRAQIANTTLCDIEAGRMEPSVRTLIRLARALGVDLNSLLPDSAIGPDQECAVI